MSAKNVYKTVRLDRYTDPLSRDKMPAVKIDATTRELERRGVNLEIDSGLAVRLASEGEIILVSIERTPCTPSGEPEQEGNNPLPARRRRGRPPINPVRFTNEPPQ